MVALQKSSSPPDTHCNDFDMRILTDKLPPSINSLLQQSTFLRLTNLHHTDNKINASRNKEIQDRVQHKKAKQKQNQSKNTINATKMKAIVK